MYMFFSKNVSDDYKGAEICVSKARLHGVTSGFSLPGDFCLFLAILVDRRTFFFHFFDLNKFKEKQNLLLYNKK